MNQSQQIMESLGEDRGFDLKLRNELLSMLGENPNASDDDLFNRFEKMKGADGLVSFRGVAGRLDRGLFDKVLKRARVLNKKIKNRPTQIPQRKQFAKFAKFGGK